MRRPRVLSCAGSLLSCAALLATGCSPAGDAAPTASPLSSAPSQEVPLSFSDITVQNEGGVAQFRGAQVGGEPGQPALPVKTVRLLLEPDADLRHIAVDVEDAVETDVQGTLQVQPAKPMFSNGVAHWPRGANIVDGKDMDVYGKNALFPASNVGRVTPGQFQRYKLVEVAVVPYRWNPVTGAMRALVSGRLVVRAAGGAEPAPGRSDPAAVAKLVANFGTGIEKYQAAASASGVEQQRSALTAGANGYAILTTEQIKNNSYLDRFADAKVAKGFAVEVVTETNDYVRNGGWACRNGSACGGGWGGGTGDAAANRLRKWMKDNYAGHNLAYVLLVGNPDPSTGDVPMKLVYSAGVSAEAAPTDLYYAELSGTWDANGNGIIGENDGDAVNGDPDVYSEVSVGRIPFYGSFGDLNHILMKTIAYGNAPAADIAWRKNALLAMKPLDTLSMPSFRVGELIRSFELTPNGWASTRVYDQDFGVAPEVTPCTFDTVVQAWRSTPRGLAIWSSHGSSAGSGEIIANDRTKQLDDVHPSFTIAMSCSIAYPESQDNLVYSLLRNGAVGAIGATRNDYSSGEISSVSGGESFVTRFAAHMVQNKAVGDALSAVHIDQSFDWKNIAVHTLYGDPSLAINTTGSGVAAPAALAAPAVQAGDRFVSLTWSAMPEASAYVVKRAGAASGPYYEIGTTSSSVTTFTDKQQILNGTTYYYVLVARNAGGDGPASPQVSATPTSPLKVQYQLGNTNPSDNVIAPVLRIVNTSSMAQPLSSVSLRYYFTDEIAGGLSFTCDSATIGCANVMWLPGWAPGGSSYIELSFGNAVPSLAAGQSVDIRVRVSPLGPGSFNETNDYSYDAARLTLADFRRITAYIGGDLKWGDEPLAPPPMPYSPEFFSAVAGNGRVNLSWASVNGVTAYKVYRSENGAPMVRLDTVAVPSYVDVQVNNGTAYTYYVAAINDGGESWPGVGITVTPDGSLSTTVPAAPTNLQASIGGGLLSVYWDASAGATAYNLKLAAVSGGPYFNIRLRRETLYGAGMVAPSAGETYYFVVSASNAVGEGPNSEELQVNSLGALPAAVTGVTPTPGNAQVSLSWSQAARATGYAIYRSVSGGAYVLAGSTQGAGARTFTNGGLENDRTYSFIVRATNTAGEGPSSTPVSATPVAAAEPCSPAQDMAGGQSNNFNTTGRVCKRTTDNIVGWGCSNFDGRTVKINNVTVTCGQTPLPPKVDGYYYFDVSAGTYPWASLYWWK